MAPPGPYSGTSTFALIKKLTELATTSLLSSHVALLQPPYLRCDGSSLHIQQAIEAPNLRSDTLAGHGGSSLMSDRLPLDWR